MAIAKGLSILSGKEKSVILMRYFRDMSQSETAVLLGVSQVQVSRIEKKARERLKEFMTE